MIRLSVFYPKTEGASFDHDYYRDKHVPLACQTWGIDASKAQIDKGIDGPYEILEAVPGLRLLAYVSPFDSPTFARVAPRYRVMARVMSAFKKLRYMAAYHRYAF